MRLLRRQNDGGYRLTEFQNEDIPRYAILSHTWGADADEVNFKDLVEGGGRAKAGFKKIRFCGDQAAKDGLEYFWIDTCSIDKTSSAELTEAINSMFEWYSKAERCYVFLSDVSTSSSDKLAFQESRWFKRGWTLQELIAPASVEFFSAEGHRLGDKHSMVEELHEITKISVQALSDGSRLSNFSVEERLSWMNGRETRKEEDMVYSLLGIFGVSMSLVYGERREKAFRRLRKEIEELDEESPRRTREREHQPFSTVPFAPDPHCVDRPEILSWMHEKCGAPGGRAALVGLGGIGKSQLAIQYTHEARRAAPHKFFFWVHAGTHARFEQAYRELADRLQLVGRNDPNVDVLKLVSDWLADESNGEWAMVLDNVDHSEIFGPSGNDSDTSPHAGLNAYLPQSSNGSILVTSRNKDVAYRLVGAYSLITEIRPMNEGEGRQLLRNKLGDVSKEDDTGEFLDALGHLPIAISQAAAYISRRAHMTMAGYLKELRMNSEKKRGLLDWDTGDLRRDESASNSVVAILQMSLNRIQQERPSAAELLSLMSFFNPQSIPEAALRRYLKGIGNSEGMDDELRRFEVDLDVLRAYSLVTATAGTDMCEMHVLVQYCTRLWLSSLGQAKRWRSAFVDLMTREFPMPTYGNWALCQQLLPHVEHLVANEPDDPAMMKAWAQLLHDAATYMQMKGSYDEAHKIAIKALVARERVLGREQESTLESVNLLARILQDQARLAEAEEYDQRNLSARRRLLGDGHELTLQSMANFGTVLQDQGRYDEAEKLYRQALEGRRKKLGDMHLDTAQSMNCLAMVLQAKARYGEGQRVHRQMFEGMQGMDTERLADTMLSSDSVSLIQYNEAQTLYRLALKAKRQELGDEHPHTLTSMSNLAAALLDQEKYDEAEVLIRRVVKGRQQLGEEHPDRLTALDILARVLGAQHKFEEAEVNSRQALEGRTKRLGEHHPDTLTSLNNLAALLMWMERYEDAAKYFQSAITGLDRNLGPQHPFTIACRSNSEILRSLEQKAHRAQKGSLYARLRARWRVKGF